MRTFLCGMALLAAIVRGGFSYKQAPQLVVLPEAASALSAPVESPRKQASGDRNDGLAHAVERQVSRTIF